MRWILENWRGWSVSKLRASTKKFGQRTRQKKGLLCFVPKARNFFMSASSISEGGDLFGALVPTHRSGATEEGLGEDDGLIGGHIEAIGK